MVLINKSYYVQSLVIIKIKISTVDKKAIKKNI